MPPPGNRVCLVTKHGIPRFYAAFPVWPAEWIACHCKGGGDSIPAGQGRTAALMGGMPASGGEQAGEQGNEGDADEGDASARHQLLHALALGSRVVVAVALQKVDRAPHAEAAPSATTRVCKTPIALLKMP